MCWPQIRLLALSGLVLAAPTVSFAQEPTQDLPSAQLIDRAFANTVEGVIAPLQTADTSVQSQSENQKEPTATPPPPPAHTGLAALVYTTWDDFKAFPRRKSTWVILGIGAGAALAAHPADNSVNAHLVGSKAVGRFWAPGKVIGSTYAEVGVSVGLYAIGRYVVSPAEGEPRTNKWSHMGFDLLRAQIVTEALVQGMKVAVRRDRPTGECCSFPSGHAAAAFATAAVIERHFGYRMALPTELIAAYVATSRLHDNRHFLSDVLFGSALGTATGWTVVGRHGRSNYVLTPVAMPGGFALQFSRLEQ